MGHACRIDFEDQNRPENDLQKMQKTLSSSYGIANKRNSSPPIIDQSLIA